MPTSMLRSLYDSRTAAKGLPFFQRMCCSNAMPHSFYGFPRLILLPMPCACLYFGLHVINTPTSYLTLSQLSANLTPTARSARARRREAARRWPLLAAVLGLGPPAASPPAPDPRD